MTPGRLDSGPDCDGQTVSACPDCNSSHVESRPGRFTEADYRCKDCRATFDEPIVREPINAGGSSRSGLAKKLVEQ